MIEKGNIWMRTKKQLGYQTPPALVNQMIRTKGQTPNTRLSTTLQKKSEEMNECFLSPSTLVIMCGLVSTSYVSLQWLVIINLEGDTSEKSLTLLRGPDRRPSLPMSRLYHYPVVMLQQILLELLLLQMMMMITLLSKCHNSPDQYWNSFWPLNPQDARW